MTIIEMTYELAKITLEKTIPAMCPVFVAYFPVHALIMKGRQQKRTNRKARPR
ncbi:hypothetical protein [Paenibacillus amylolyticus]|uniref:hypothetical protein n=1 Tax=Paenibacillus amylolyticus TaxID=1451 RepID=UPI00201DD374|nr:hypothetical protein [Paenibacillus amylolyticus]MCL6661761.1 hypothetical protein [Paenibacillus amylolyticus]